MKTIYILLFAAIAAFAQEPSKGYYAGGFSGGGAFAVVGLRLNDSTSTYTNAGLAGTMTVSQGVVRNMVTINGFKLSVLGEAGAALTGNSGFAGALGGVVAYDISKWLAGTSVIGIVKIEKTGDVSHPVYGIGLSKSF